MHLGTRFQMKFVPRVYGYAKAGGVIGLGSLRFAADLEEEDPISSVKASGSSFGGVASLGVMYRSKPVMQRLQLQAYLEVGYAHQSEIEFSKDTGSVQLQGVHSSLGLGIRF